MHTVDTVGIPRFGHLQRAKEHLIQTQGVRSELGNHVIGIDHIEHRLTHLLYRPTADVLLCAGGVARQLGRGTIGKDELGILELRHPCAESVDVQHIVVDDIHIHVNRLHFILVLGVLNEVVRDIEIARRTLADIAIDEVRTALNHTLIDQLLERLIFANIAQIIEELIPETRINQVSRSMLATAQIQIHLTPVLVRLFAHERLVVMRIHISQIIGRRTGEARHGTQLQRMTFILPVLRIAQRRTTIGRRFEVFHFR